MHSLRIKGLVRLADRVRRELAQPVSPAVRDNLRRLTTEALEQVERILSDHRTSIGRLPAPTRRAYAFLQGLDFDAVPVEANGAGAGSSNISLTGLKAYWDYVLQQLAITTAPERLDGLHQDLGRETRNVESYLENERLRASDLTPTTRTIRGWLAFFAERQNFDDYIAAVRSARPLFEAALRRNGRFRPPAFINFRPTNSLYRLRGYPDGTRVILPTPAISFSPDEFAALAEAALNGGPKQPVLETLAGETCQAIDAELEALGGVVEQTAGLFHDLAVVHERVCRRYLDRAVPRPRLTWSRTFTGRKFGHYDRVRDLVMVSASLDRQDVPEFAVDFIMYHELLHKQLGLDWRCGRAHAHTPQFRKEERRFERFAEAEAVLTRIATRR